MPSTKQLARGLALTALLAPSAAFMCGPSYPCGSTVNFSGAQAVMKALQKFEPRVEQTSDAVMFQFQADSADDLEANINQLGNYANILNVKWNNAEMPFGFQGMANRSGMARTFFMPCGLDTQQMSTSFANGVYTVKLPRKVQDEVAKQSAASDSASSSSSKQEQTRQQPYSAADYLKSLSNAQNQDSQTSQTKTQGQQQQQQQRSSSSNSNTSGPTSIGQYVDSVLADVFGVPPGTDPFAPPNEEQIAAAKAQAARTQAQAAKMQEARKARYTAMRRASMHVNWEQSSDAYTISIDIPEQTASGDVKLVSVAKRGLEVRLAKGGVRRISLPSDARISGVSAKFDRDSEQGEDLVRRCIVTVPKDQPQTINIQMA